MLITKMLLFSRNRATVPRRMRSARLAMAQESKTVARIPRTRCGRLGRTRYVCLIWTRERNPHPQSCPLPYLHVSRSIQFCQYRLRHPHVFKSLFASVLNLGSSQRRLLQCQWTIPPRLPRPSSAHSTASSRRRAAAQSRAAVRRPSCGRRAADRYPPSTPTCSFRRWTCPGNAMAGGKGQEGPSL